VTIAVPPRRSPIATGRAPVPVGRLGARRGDSGPDHRFAIGPAERRAGLSAILALTGVVALGAAAAGIAVVLLLTMLYGYLS
jgi:hypothetical protein